MAIEVTMPKLGLTMSEGVLARWLVKDGEKVRKGQPIFEIETDKAVAEAESTGDGVLHIVAEAGSTVPVMGSVAYILSAGEKMPGKPQISTEGFAELEPKQPDLTPAEVKASPLARRLAREAGIDLSTIQGTGDSGRITKEDVERAIVGQQASTAAETTSTQGELIALSGVRLVTAQRMSASSRQTAPVTITTEIDATELVNMRTQLNEGVGIQPGFSISYNDVLLKAVAICLREFGYMNARLEGNAIRRLPEVHVGLAVDTERGLLVPVVRDADRKALLQISRELREKTQRALAGKSTPDELAGGTFTITNLGAFGIDAFTPIINLPEMAVLGVGRIQEKPVAHMGQMLLRHRMALSLTFDHRLVDGAPAARFLQRLGELIEKPYPMIDGVC